jgi:hypothetical protein
VTRRSRLPEDPDARLVRWGWLAWFVAAMLFAWLAWRAGGHEDEALISWVLGAPVLALGLLWPLWRGARAFWHWTRTQPHAAWHGTYFEFNGRQIRVVFEADDVWVAADDVFDVFGLGGRAREPERVRQIAGRDGLVVVPGTRLLAFTGRGFEAWMERRTDRAAAEFRRWFDAQVVAPHRRKRAMLGTATPTDRNSVPADR